MRLRISECLWNELVHHLHERQDVETAAVLVAHYYRTGDDAIAVVRHIVRLSDEAYVARCPDRLSIDPVAINRLARRAHDMGMCVFTAHSHPRSDKAFFSWADDDGDDRFLASMRNWIGGVPHGSIVVASSGDTKARALTDDGMRDVDIHIIGRSVSMPVVDLPLDERFARQRLALGSHGQAILRRMRVGVVGVGGVGSVVTVQLAHLGVGEAVLVDGDRVERSNLSRIIGAGLHDVGSAKVDVAARYVRDTGLPLSVQTLADPLRGGAELAALRMCDVIFSCVDRFTPRSILNRLAYEALIPVVDLGTGFRVDQAGIICGEAGRVVVVGPGRPCLGCWGHLDAHALRVEAIQPEERKRLQQESYIEGADVEQPSVIAFNTMVAGAGVIEFLRIVTAFANEEPPNRLAFSFASGTVRRNTLQRNPECRICAPLLMREKI
jgi:molybdopterin/thiamine biosynthesis adenylyltransferase